MGARAYDAAVEALGRALVFGINPSLDGIRMLVGALGNPERTFSSIQVTGTNGKTSTARYAAAILRGEGVRTGLYTSPHLARYPERIELDGCMVSDEEFSAAVHAALVAAEDIRPGALGEAQGFTEFELLTAAALWHFERSGVEIAVLEVGLGGTWDATSIVHPVTAVITGVGLDHASILGDTVEQIAVEKAGIIKPGSAVVLGPGTSDVAYVFTQKAEALGAPLLAVREQDAGAPCAEASTTRFSILSRPAEPGGLTTLDVSSPRAVYDSVALRAPSWQGANAATALAAAESALGRALNVESARAALLNTVLPARFELVCDQPPIVVDGSHNPQAAGVLSAAIAEAWPDTSRRPTVLLGILADKDAAGIVTALDRVAARLAACTPESDRALPADELRAIVERVTGRTPLVFHDMATALAELIASSPDGLVVTGSLVTAGSARSLLQKPRSERHSQQR